MQTCKSREPTRCNYSNGFDHNSTVIETKVVALVAELKDAGNKDGNSMEGGSGHSGDGTIAAVKIIF